MRSIWKDRHQGDVRPRQAFFGLCCGIAALLAGTAATQDAAANGDTRSLTFLHTHTRETATVTFRRDGRYDERGLEQLNWLLRDWRVEKPAKMDPQLFDILWEVYREAGSTEPIEVISAYRSPITNAMLRRRSRAVSEHSQHMLGKAIDVRMPDIETGRLRAIAMKLQYGGVGFYPDSAFVHIDTGSVRAWPRMSDQQLARLFPDGKTVHLPANGKPLPRYEEARAELQARAGRTVMASAGGGAFGSILSNLFRGGGPAQPAPAVEAAQPTAPAEASPAPVALAAAEPRSDALAYAPLPPRRPAALVVASAGDLPLLGPVAATAAPSAAPAPAKSPVGEVAPENLSPASRLLFSAVPISAAPGKAAVAAQATAADFRSPGSHSFGDGFLRQPPRQAPARFTGRAIGGTPLVQQAQAEI